VRTMDDRASVLCGALHRPVGLDQHFR
jgi:hypothetical protein